MAKVIMRSLVHSPEVRKAEVSKERKLLNLFHIKEKVEQMQKALAALVEEHDKLAVELGAPRIGKQKRSTEEEIAECRVSIVKACCMPQKMSAVIEALSDQFSDTTIKLQTKYLLDNGRLVKFGDRGSNVMYIDSAQIKSK